MTHRPRHRPTGILGTGRAVTTDRDPYAQLGAKIHPQPNGCWQFEDRPLDEYVQTHSAANPQEQRAHRLVYSILRGPIPLGMVLHHECENPGCVNPAHCVPMTNVDHLAHHRALVRTTDAPPP